MDINTRQATPALSAREGVLAEICVKIQSAVMSGHIARGLNAESSLKAAEKSADICLAAGRRLCDANLEDFGVLHSGVRLGAASDLYAAAVAGSVARGEPAETAINTASLNREAILRSANAVVLNAQSPKSSTMDAATPLSDRESAGVAVCAKIQSAVISGQMARGVNVETSLRSAESSADVCLVAATRLYDANIEDFGVTHAGVRLGAASELYAAAVAGSVARGERPDEAIHMASRSRDGLLRSAQVAVLKEQSQYAPAADPSVPRAFGSILGAQRAMNALGDPGTTPSRRPGYSRS
jgi:hypothetical protein